MALSYTRKSAHGGRIRWTVTPAGFLRRERRGVITPLEGPAKWHVGEMECPPNTPKARKGGGSIRAFGVFRGQPCPGCFARLIVQRSDLTLHPFADGFAILFVRTHRVNFPLKCPLLEGTEM